MPNKPSTEDKGWLALQQGRGYVKQKFPFFYSGMISLVPRHVPNIQTMLVTENLILAVDMEWLPSLPPDQVGGMLCNCTMRVLRDIKRLQAMPDQRLAEYAFDMPINDDLKAFNVPLPEWAVYSSTHKFPPGLSGEKYYQLCEEKGIFPPPEKITAHDLKELLDADSIKRDGRSPTEVLHIRRQALQELKKHIDSKSYGRGYMPGSLQELLEFDGTEEAVIPWESVMQSNMDKSFGRVTHGQSDYSYARPSKRSYSLGLLRPGLVGYEPVVCYIEDSSGSMGPEQLKANRTEVGKCMRQLGLTSVWFLQADVHVRNTPRFITINELMTLPVIGRGGTNFIQPIEAAMRLRPKPDVIIYSTDGEGLAPDYQPRNTEFIWLLAPGPWTRSPCNWGKQILTTNDPHEKKKYELLR